MQDEARFVVIMAGGSGSRLWPLSRPERPKQFLPLIDGQSMLQVTWCRACELAPPERILIVGDVAHRALYHAQLPDLPAANLLLEPTGRDTAPCIALAALHARQRHPASVLLVLSVDHLILNRAEWRAAMETAAAHAAETGRLVALGRTVDVPERRFGYMVCGVRLHTDNARPIHTVERFVEKPSEAELQHLLQVGPCLRSMGMFAWKAQSLLEEIEACQPAVAAALRGYEDHIGTDREQAALRAAYASMPAISIDHGVLQCTERLSVVENHIDRIDVGDFSAFAVLWERDLADNVVRGDYVHYDSARNIVFSSGMRVATVGIRDCVIVADGDTVLVCPKDRTQDIKQLLNELKDHHG